MEVARAWLLQLHCEECSALGKMQYCSGKHMIDEYTNQEVAGLNLVAG